MIAFLKGICVERNAEYIVIEVNGIGYQMGFSQQDKLTLNQEVTIFTYLHVREDEISLYGFLTPKDKDVFLKLISVKGIGPKIALNIFRQSNAERLIKAIAEGNVSYLKSLPGIGPKTASQIVLDLKGRLIEQVESTPISVANQNIMDALEGLKNLGYRPAEINAIKAQLSEHEEETVDELMRIGLQLLLNQRRKN